MLGIWSYLTGSKGPSGFGSSTTAEQVAHGISAAALTVIVTGATSGIGVETSRVLARQGACVVIPARKLQSAEDARSKILKELPDARVIAMELDLSSLDSVRKFVKDFKAMGLPLNVLINNAGIASRKFLLSKDGLELDFATNHMGHFLLVELLLDDMIKTASETGIGGRIVIVASEAHRFVPKRGIVFDKLNDENSFSWMGSYGQSKLANVLHARELAKRLKERNVNVTANALHPGPIDTGLSRDFNALLAKAVFMIGKPFTKNIKQGAATSVYAALHPSLEGVSGEYLLDCNIADTAEKAKDMGLAAELWAFSEKFIQDHP